MYGNLLEFLRVSSQDPEFLIKCPDPVNELSGKSPISRIPNSRVFGISGFPTRLPVLVRISDRPGIIGYTGGAQNSAGGGPTVRVILSRCPRYAQRSERWMYRSAGPNWRIQVNSSEYMYLSGKRCNTILKFRTSGTRYSRRRLRVPLVRKHSQFSSLSSVTLFWRQTLN